MMKKLSTLSLLAVLSLGAIAIAQQGEPNRINNHKSDCVNFRCTNLRVDSGIMCDRTILTDTIRYKHLLKISTRESKADIKQLDTDTAQAIVSNLAPVSFRYKSDAANARRTFGFVAEDADKRICGIQADSIPSDDIVAVLTAVVRDQQCRIERLELKIKSANSPE